MRQKPLNLNDLLPSNPLATRQSPALARFSHTPMQTFVRALAKWSHPSLIVVLRLASGAPAAMINSVFTATLLQYIAPSDIHALT